MEAVGVKRGKQGTECEPGEGRWMGRKLRGARCGRKRSGLEAQAVAQGAGEKTQTRAERNRGRRRRGTGRRCVQDNCAKGRRRVGGMEMGEGGSEANGC